VGARDPDVVGSFGKDSDKDKNGTTLGLTFELLTRIILLGVRVF